MTLRFESEVPLLAALMAGGGLSSRVDSERLREAAVHHRVVGYVVAAAEQGRVDLELSCRHWLMARQTAETAQTRRLCAELMRLQPLLSSACGSRPLLVKGPAVAERLYPDARLRPYRDLDLVVSRDRLQAAARAMAAELGYRRTEEPWAGYGERQGHHIGLARRVDVQTVTVELHWRIGDDPVAEGLDYSRLSRTSESLPLSDGADAVMVPSPEEHLLVLAVHLLHETDKRLMWVNDLVLAAESASPAQWQAAFDGADELGLSWVLHRALDYGAVHLGLDRPRPAMPARAPRLGPLRAGERFDGWLGVQVGRLALGGWTASDGYLRSAARARRGQLIGWLRRRAGDHTSL